MGLADFTPHHVDLIYQATLASFWRRKALRKFLRGCGVSEAFLSAWAEEESKRDLLDRLFEKLRELELGERVLAKMSSALREQTTFPDLRGWEEAEQKIAAAHRAVEALKIFESARLEQRATAAESEAAKARHRAQQEQVRRAGTDLEKLTARLTALTPDLGKQHGGYAFQDWFYDFLEYFEVTCRRPYVSKGRQIDGSLTLEGTTYLVELKFTSEQAGAPDIDTFLKKVNDKADNTMGVFVSISGYSSVAIAEASGPRTPLLLLDHGHVYAALGRIMSFPDILGRVRRHVSQTSEAYLPVSRFSG